MNQLIPAHTPATNFPALIIAGGEQAAERFIDFFTSNIRNRHTREAYGREVNEFMHRCEECGVRSLAAVKSLHVAAWIEAQAAEASAPTVKQRLAAVRHLFDWLVVGQIVPVNPASSVRGPKHIVLKGKTPVLDAAKARALIDSIDATTIVGLRDRALIGLMVYSFARISAALGMKVKDVYRERRRLWVRLREKRGKRHEMRCHHNLESDLEEYIDKTCLTDDPKGSLFRTISRKTKQLIRSPLPRVNAYAMVQRRATATGIKAWIGNHSFRATGITAYLKNGGTLETAASMANHASTHTTQVYHRRADEVTLEEVERVGI
jgi:site-specific recombinase XerD